MAIQSFKHKGLEKLFRKGKTAKIGKQYHKNLILILDLLADLDELENCWGVKDFHELKGDRGGTYSMHISGNYCLTFKWDGENVYDVNFEDYH